MPRSVTTPKDPLQLRQQVSLIWQGMHLGAPLWCATGLGLLVIPLHGISTTSLWWRLLRSHRRWLRVTWLCGRCCLPGWVFLTAPWWLGQVRAAALTQGRVPLSSLLIIAVGMLALVTSIGLTPMERYYKGMVRLIRSRDITIDGPVFSDSCGWNTTPRHCENVTVKRLKIFNNRPALSCINTDGLNPDGCQNVTIDHCLFHTGDDAVAVKSTNYGGEPADCCDITVRDLLAINNSATAKIGTETMAGRMERIHFERIIAVRTARLVALDAYDHATISDVSWTDCDAHQWADLWTDAYLIHMFAPDAGGGFRPLPGQASARGIRLSNISSTIPAPCVLDSRETDSGPAITDVAVDNISSGGESVTLQQPTPT